MIGLSIFSSWFPNMKLLAHGITSSIITSIKSAGVAPHFPEVEGVRDRLSQTVMSPSVKVDVWRTATDL